MHGNPRQSLAELPLIQEEKKGKERKIAMHGRHAFLLAQIWPVSGFHVAGRAEAPLLASTSRGPPASRYKSVATCANNY